MRILLHIAIPIVLLAAAAAPAQDAMQRFAVGGFDRVEQAGPDRVRIVVGDAQQVVATGDPRAVAALRIGVRGGVLRIDRRSGPGNSRGATITVTVPRLRGVAVSGSGGATVDGVAGPAFRGDLSGSGSLAITDLRAGTADLHSAGSGSGSISAGGRADRLTIDLGGSGSIDAHRLATPDVSISTSGSGDVDAVATRDARVRAGGSGNVRVTGGASCDVRRDGSGIVRCG